MFDEQIYHARLKKFQAKLQTNILYILSNPSQIAYFTGFKFLVSNERESFLICSKKYAKLIHTSFAPICNFSFLDYLPGSFPHQLKQHLEKLSQETGIKKVAYDSKTLFVAELDEIKKIDSLEVMNIDLNFITQLMTQKDRWEIKAIKQAGKITHQVFDTIKPQLKVGLSELAVAEMISQKFQKQGIENLAFPTIVAFGTNSAKPHHQPSQKKLIENTVVLIDMGGKLNQYCSDMTRTFWFGPQPSDLFQKIETIVLQAYDQAFKTAGKHIKGRCFSKRY
jgi:Xaa-Pro aminopeptidase